MRQDLEAGRVTEVDLFAGTVLELSKKHGIDCPVNRMLYDRIREMKSRF
jgi:2-dehydropantoate 2-reductase